MENKQLELNTPFLQKADMLIDEQMEIMSKALQEKVINERDGQGYDPILSVTASILMGSKVIHQVMEDVGEDIAESRQNVENISLYLSEKLMEYPGKSNLMDVVQALLALSSSICLSFAEDYHNEQEKIREAEETTERL